MKLHPYPNLPLRSHRLWVEPSFIRQGVATAWTAVKVIGLLLLVLAPACSRAQGFAAYVSPPRIEVELLAGETLRQVVELQHGGNQPGQYRFYTNDWTLSADGAVTFSDDLAPDSCRPWVAIERRDLTLSAGARYLYRLEISPPKGTPARECRFALMIEGLDPTRVTGALSFPVNGRIAVIVYAVVGGAKSTLSVIRQQAVTLNGQLTATLDVVNTGKATGRLEGFVNGTDANGKTLEFSPADTPILPGATRRITLNPVVEVGQASPVVAFPLRIKGFLEWADQRLIIDTRFAP